MALRADEMVATPSAGAPPDPAQTIKFMCSAGEGRPNVIIHQTNSSTGPVTEEFLARDIIAKHRRIPKTRSRLSRPLRTDILNEPTTHLSRPIILPKSYDPRITVKPADRNRDSTPTVLPVAPK